MCAVNFLKHFQCVYKLKKNSQLTVFRTMMDIHIFGMFSSSSQQSRRDHLDGTLHSVQLVHLRVLLLLRIVADLDRFDVESTIE